MKCFVIGCGSIGERHIRNLKTLSVSDIIAYDVDLKRLNFIKQKYKITTSSTIDNGFKQNPDIALVCTPPVSHISIAKMAIDNNIHVFIEKPISNTLEGVNELLKKAKKKDLTVFVGYNFRFQKGIQLTKKLIENGKIGRILSARAEFGQYLPDWRSWQDYTKSYTAKKELGGGIILDGSHEIDYMRWFVGDVDKVFCFADKVSNLKVETEDIAEILIRFKKKILGEIHLDFIRHGYSRNCEIIGEDGVITWDFLTNTVKVYESSEKKWDIKKLSGKTNDMYIEELKYFLNVIKTGKKPLIDGEEGKKTLEVALAAKKSAESKKVVKV